MLYSLVDKSFPFQFFFNKHIIIYLKKFITFFPPTTKMSLYFFNQRRGYPYIKRKIDSRKYSLFPKDLALRQVFFIIKTRHGPYTKFREKKTSKDKEIKIINNPTM